MRSLLRVALIAAAVLAAVVYAAYRRDIDREFDRISTGSQIAQTPCGQIEYTIAGEGDPVLAVHGAGGGFDQVGTDLVGRPPQGSLGRGRGVSVVGFA